jgi:acyl-CoA reductase-like NAD-dependent aldehyde dehydrogenase
MYSDRDRHYVNTPRNLASPESGTLGMNLDAASNPASIAPYVEGAMMKSRSETAVDIVNPSTGRRLMQMSAGSELDVDRAVASARRAFDDSRWRAAAPSQRQKVLRKFADLIEAEAPSLDTLDAGEMGKPVAEAFGNAVGAAGLARFYAEAINKVSGDAYPCDRNSLVLQRKVPRGVVAAIVPWNFPTYNAVLKVAPALAAGNSVVLKPSELSSRSAVRLAQLATLAGVPNGVFNVLPGLGETVGRALGLHSQVDMIAFTGSTEIGKAMLQYAGQSNMKVVMAECGGKSPQVVFDDGVDLDAVAESITRFLLTNQGQICSVGSRVLVERSIESVMIEKITSRMQSIVMGDALDPKTTFGPLVSRRQCDRVMQYIETAEREGARLVAGGRRALPASGGYFVEPTIFRNVSATARIAREEIFGPVLSVIPFRDEAEAIRIANGTKYGLAAYVWTANLSRGMRMVEAIRSPIWINAAAPRGEGAGHATSFEPFGESGMGAEGGLAGMESYMRRQLVCFGYA